MTTAPPMTPQRWARLDDCVTCSAPAGQPCIALTAPHDDLTKPHRTRTPRVDRLPDGELLLGRWHNVGGSVDARSTAAALHVSIEGAAVCTGGDLVSATMKPLDDTRPGDRCRRPPCKRIWAAEAWQ